MISYRVVVGQSTSSTGVLAILTVATAPVRLLGRGVVNIGDIEATGLLILAQFLQSPTVGWILSWMLYLVAFYKTLPRVYPGVAGERLEDDRPLRLVIAVFTALTGIVFERRGRVLETQIADLTGSPLPPVNHELMYITLLVSSLCTVVGLFIRYRWLTSVGIFNAIFELSDAIVTLLARVGLLRNEPESDTNPEDIVIDLLDSVITVTIITAGLSLAAIAANLLFPAAELLLLLWFGLVNYSRFSVERYRDATDIETRLYDVVEIVRFGPKGVSVLLTVALGALPAVVTCIFAAGAIPAIAQSALSAGELTVEQLIVTLLGVPMLVAYGGYSLWYWLRIFRRLPDFLEVWESQPQSLARYRNRLSVSALLRVPGRTVKQTVYYSKREESDDSVGDSDPESLSSTAPTRPPGALVQPAVLYLVFNLLLVSQAVSLPDDISPPFVALFCYILLVFLWWMWRSVQWTLASPSQRLAQDNVVIPVAATVQMWLYLSVLRLEEQDIGQLDIVTEVFLSTLLDLVIPMFALFYLFDAIRAISGTVSGAEES